MRNLLCFLYRLCGDAPAAASPWTLARCLDRYRTLRCHVRTGVALGAHARWITLLLRCPGYGDGGVCTMADLRSCNPATHRRRLAPTLRRHAFTVDEVTRLYAASTASVYDRLLLAVLFTTALRIGGVRRLPTPLSPTETWVVTQEKGGQHFPVALAPCVHTLLHQLQQARPGEAYILPSPRFKGRPASTSHLKKRFRRLCHLAGVTGTHAHVHSCRHTLATALRLAGRRIVDIQAFLGHASPITTVAVYCTPHYDDLLGLLHLPWFATDTASSDDRQPAHDSTLLNALCPPVL